MKNDQAFPSTERRVHSDYTENIINKGLSTREYIAIHAMQALITAGYRGFEHVAESAIKYTYALINELNK